MPTDPRYESALRLADLFRMRNAERLGLTVSDADHARDADLSAFGESLGLGARGGNSMPSAPAMPGKPVVSGPPEVPAGDALSSLAPAMAGAEPTGQTEAMNVRANPTGPGTGAGKSGIPALDAMTDKPRKRNRGMYHNRRLGRVLSGGDM